MSSNPFVKFDRIASAAGYPSLFVVTILALAVVVAPILLLALTRAVWTLALALLGVLVALLLLAGALDALLAEDDATAPRGRDGSRSA